MTAAWRHPNLLAGGALTGLLVVVALVSLVWTPYAFDAIAVADRLQAPGPAHWFGTDLYGRDIAARLMVGARNSILVGIVAVGLGASLGVPLVALVVAVGFLVDIAYGLIDPRPRAQG
jgi:peptide/nickel transport system permease protein